VLTSSRATKQNDVLTVRVHDGRLDVLVQAVTELSAGER
jgi:hypothetical protein